MRSLTSVAHAFPTLGVFASDERDARSSPAESERSRGNEGEKKSELEFVAAYDAFAPFVHRAVIRLGVPVDAAEDATQEVFLVVHRRLAEFDHRATLRTWIYGIALRVARNHRRTRQRQRLDAKDRAPEHETSSIPDSLDRTPDALMEKAQAAALLATLLDSLDDDLREVFVLAELEAMPVVDIAHALGANQNTVYSRLRAARRDFEKAAARARARDEWRMR